jgi:hypothetical protein
MTKQEKLRILCLAFTWLLGIGFTNAFAQLAAFLSFGVGTA